MESAPTRVKRLPLRGAGCAQAQTEGRLVAANLLVGADACIRPRDRLTGKMMPVSQQSWPVRAVQCPTGALIATRPRDASIDPYNLTVKRYSLANPSPAAREFPLREAFASARPWLKNPSNSQNFSLVYRPFPCYNKLVFANTPFYIN